MISFIRGTVADLTENSAIIESNCIGFEINMTGPNAGNRLKLIFSRTVVKIIRSFFLRFSHDKELYK